MKPTHYPTYDVLKHREDWDPHTRAIVINRVIREHGYRFLKIREVEVIRAVCSHLAGDDRGEVIQFVLCHIDETLANDKGEGDRKRNIPEERKLIRSGIAALDRSSLILASLPFQQIGVERQVSFIDALARGRLDPPDAWRDIPQQAFFSKLLQLTVDAYYSHPTIWSEIGYGGPAYPRGYIRTDIGQIDPWEAKRET